MRIFSSAEYCLRVAQQMSLMTCFAGAFPVPQHAPWAVRNDLGPLAEGHQAARWETPQGFSHIRLINSIPI
jgi:hypothetical protein